MCIEKVFAFLWTFIESEELCVFLFYVFTFVCVDVLWRYLHYLLAEVMAVVLLTSFKAVYKVLSYCTDVHNLLVCVNTTHTHE